MLEGFVQLLRAAGLLLGSDRVLLAQAALAQVGLRERSALHAALRASLPSQPEELPLFDAAFALYWRAPDARLADLLPALPPLAQLQPRRPTQAGPPQRLLDAIRPPHAWRPTSAPPSSTRLGASSAEDASSGPPFDALAAAEEQGLKQLQRQVQCWLQGQPQPPSRRWQPSQAGALALRAALQRLQAGRPLLPLPRQRRRVLVAQQFMLIDISGSMQEHSRRLLLLAARLARQSGWRCHAFGTRLVALDALLRQGLEPDQLLRRFAEQGLSSSGGTRIGVALQSLREREGPRLSAGRCSLLLFSDGLEHDPQDPLLPSELARWRQLGVRLLWIDPLARADLRASPALAQGCDARWPLPA